MLPTLAAVLGLPVAEDLPGKVQDDWFTVPPRPERVGSYDPEGPYVPDVPDPGEASPQALEDLKALGYIR